MAQVSIATWLIVPALVISAVGILIWKKLHPSYVKVGTISRLFFHPVKSLKAIEVKSGKCTKIGLEVNGVLERSFLLVDKKGCKLYVNEVPTMILLTPRIDRKTLVISTPSGEELKVKIKHEISAEDKIIDICIEGKVISAVDCGDEAANFLQSFLKVSYVRLVRYFPPSPEVAFPDFAPYHILSQASIDDVNSKLDGEQISVLNFRPNIVAENCTAFAEDTWKCIKFPEGVELNNFIMTTRCVYTTNNPSTGVITLKEPINTLRKYRIPNDQTIFKKCERYKPCVGIYCGCIKLGKISVGDDIYAQVGDRPEMIVK
ncbi:hypothetical protein JTE90_012449 [Oedothorax gibbosus]|uniref:MOSC domain-containing protein n=1 Tax=Oedothorax gibbosus TaxID=931172 RepID=A0AAV6TZS5_9ARAC|nr:hypothetical protein JTE90_012449 [Oedothorax gibbosus]